MDFNIGDVIFLKSDSDMPMTIDGIIGQREHGANGELDERDDYIEARDAGYRNGDLIVRYFNNKRELMSGVVRASTAFKV